MGYTVDAKPLASLFRPSFFSKIGENCYRKHLNEILHEANCIHYLAGQRTLLDILSIAYKELLALYRCEYVFKNTILNNLFLSRHSFSSSYYTTEFRCGSARADIVIANGTTTAYEIKTAYDSFEKIENQMNEYHSVFDRVYIVTTDSLKRKALRYCRDETGILILNKKLSLGTFKQALSNKHNTSPRAIFDCMRQTEYLNALKGHSNNLVDIPNSLRYTRCKELYSALPVSAAHDLMLEQLRRRTPETVKLPILATLPDALKQVWLEISGTKAELHQIATNLQGAVCAP